MRYRRATVPGASYFFTLITYQRKPLFADPNNVVRWHRAIAKVQRKRPFVVEAEVVMPDHLHTIWTLPEIDADYATRIRLIKTAFTKELSTSVAGTSANKSRISKG
jgi:putative transposase